MRSWGLILKVCILLWLFLIPFLEKTYVKDTGGYPGGENTDETFPKIDFYTSSKTQFGYFFFGDIGYRYQRPNGFMFRVGVSPSFNFGDKYGLKKAAFFPYIDLGWSF